MLLLCIRETVSTIFCRGPLIFISQLIATIMSLPVVYSENMAAAHKRWERIQFTLLWETSLCTAGPIMWKLLLLLPLYLYNSGKVSVAQKSLFREQCGHVRSTEGKRIWCLPSPAMPASCFYATTVFVKYCSDTMLLFIVPSAVRAPRTNRCRGLKFLTARSASDTSDERNTNKSSWCCASALIYPTEHNGLNMNSWDKNNCRVRKSGFNVSLSQKSRA